MAPQVTVEECDRILTAPGCPLEMEEAVLCGRRVRVWKHLPPTFRAFLLDSLDKYSSRTFLSSPCPLALDAGDFESRSNKDRREYPHFGEVLQRSLRLAAWMREQGLGVGSRVAIGGGNSAGWIIAFVATHLIGGITIALNAWLPLDSLTYCLTLTNPHLILLDSACAALLRSARHELSKQGVGQMYCWSPSSEIEQLEMVVESSQVSADMAGTLLDKGLESLGPESDAVIFFTSGTGGSPKAVLSTQRMALSNMFSGMVAPGRAALRAGLSPPPFPKASDPQRTVLLAIPLFHVTGCLSWLMRAFLAGSKMVLMGQWETAEAVRLIEQEGVTVIGGVPSVVSSILHSPVLSKDRSFDTVFYGGAPPSKQLAAEVKGRWPKAGLVQGYGLTETNAYVCSVAGSDYVEKPDATGPAVPICDIRIVGPLTRRPVPSGSVGLLLVRGPQVMKEYYGNQAATEEAIDKDGWLDTGDIGMVDAEGFLYIKDRLKDIIIRGGENIASIDVENALYADPRVSEAVAIGVPHSRLGEVVGAAVALHPNINPGTKNPLESELVSGVHSRLGRRACPEIILIWDGALPRNVNGKIVKKDIKPILIDAWEKRGRGRKESKL